VSRLSELAISKRSVVLLIAASVLFGGVYAWQNLKQELVPDIEFPIITVIAAYPGAGAADVTEQVTKPMERAIGSVPNLKSLQSTSANSISVVAAQFAYGTNVKEARSTIEQNLTGVGLPDTVKPEVTALNINATPVIIASIASTSGDLESVGTLARTVIVPNLAGLDGVSSVDVTGGLEQRVQVTLDPAKLTATGITAAQVSGVLAANNLTFPSGALPVDPTNIPVSTTNRYSSVEEISNLVVGVQGATTPTVPGAGAGAPSPSAAPSGAPGTVPTPIRLGDISTSIELVGVPTTGYARTGTPETGAQPSVTLTVTKSSGANTVQVADAVNAELADIQARYPDQIQVTTVSDLSTFIKESRDGLLKEGGLGALFAILTIFLFLGSLRSTLVAAMSIPLSILTALVLMLAGGITLNIMTLGGLAVAVGRVVDDAIVVLENIYRHRARGEDRVTAALSGTREVAGAITSSTITTVAVFLPLGLVGGLVSQFFLPFAITVSFALLASLVVALTVIPVLAYFIVDRVKVDVDETGEPKHSIWVRAYVPTIRMVLRSRWTKLGTVALATVLFFATTALVPSIPTQFLNTGSEKILAVYLAPPAGTSSAVVLERAIEAEDILLAQEEVELVQTSVPGESNTGYSALFASFSGRPANSATLTVRLDPSVDLKAETEKLIADLGSVAVDGWSVTVTEAAGFGGSSTLTVIVSAQNQALVAQGTAAVLSALQDQPDLVNLKTDLSKATPEIQVKVDPTKATMIGSSTAQIAAEVRGALVGASATRVQLGNDGAVDVYVQIDPAGLNSVDALRALRVGTVAKVPLGTIADVAEVDAQGSITRIDQAPASSISAEITSPDQGAVSASVQDTIDGLVASGEIPPSVDVRLAGVTQQQNEAFSGLFVAMGVAVLLVYVTLVLTFNSLITPFIILFSLPLATIGAFPALVITGRPIGISALIGFLMLIGIVVTNAIVLLDLVERLRREGHSTTEALVEGGKTRVRPILMTALATMLALIPLAAGFNQGSIIAAELGTVVIGGLFSSTFLTLIVVPVVYSLVDGGKTGLGGWSARRAKPAVKADESPAGGQAGEAPTPA
jgi:HAE1 family hydrophobic/amphiphilic exporter-1